MMLNFRKFILERKSLKGVNVGKKLMWKCSLVENFATCEINGTRQERLRTVGEMLIGTSL